MQTLFLIVAIVCSILSQLPDNFGADGIGGVMKLTWLLPGISMLMTNGNRAMDKPLLLWYYFIVVFTTYLLFCTLISVNVYFNTDYVNMCISMCICVISYLYWERNKSAKNLKWIAVTFLILCCIFASVIYVDVLADLNIMARHEIYAAKNSAAQIILAGGIIAFCCLKPSQTLYKIVLYAALVFMFVIIMIMRSRATIASMFAIIIYYIWTRPKAWQKVLFTFIVLFAAVVIVSVPEYYDMVVENILFAGRAGDNVDDLSSGRTILIAEAWQKFVESPIIGIGSKYIDCMPLAMMLQFGIIGFSIVMAFIINVWKFTARCRNFTPVGQTAFLLLVAFLVNSLFEAQPPFGPGIKCFMLWMFIGFSYSDYYWRKPKLIRK